MLAKAIGNLSNISEFDSPSAAQIDLLFAQCKCVSRIAENPDGLTRPCDFRLTPCGIHVLLAQNTVNLGRSHTKRLHLGRIKHNPDFAIDATVAANRRHALDRQETP